MTGYKGLCENDCRALFSLSLFFFAVRFLVVLVPRSKKYIVHNYQAMHDEKTDAVTSDNTR